MSNTEARVNDLSDPSDPLTPSTEGRSPHSEVQQHLNALRYFCTVSNCEDAKLGNISCNKMSTIADVLLELLLF